MTETEYQHPLMKAYWAQLDTGFKPIEDVFEDVMAEALAILTREGIDAYLEAARVIGKLGRGVEPMLAFMEEWPTTAKALGESALPEVMALIQRMQKSPNGKAITPFLQTLAPVARKLHSQERMGRYLDIALDFMERTTGSIHGHHTTFPSPGLPDFFDQAPFLLGQLSVAGLRNWVEYGIRNYRTHPERQKDYFSLQSADSRAVLQRERHGTLFMDVERKLDLYLRGLWQEAEQLVPYSTAFDELRKPVPYYDKLGMRIPDVYDDRRTEISRSSTATASRSRTWSATAAGPRPRSPTTGARSSAWRWSSSKIAGSKSCCAANIPASGASSWRCIRSRSKVPATRKPPPVCATAWPCCRAPCSTRITATAMPICSTSCSAFTP